MNRTCSYKYTLKVRVDRQSLCACADCGIWCTSSASTCCRTLTPTWCAASRSPPTPASAPRCSASRARPPTPPACGCSAARTTAPCESGACACRSRPLHLRLPLRAHSRLVLSTCTSTTALRFGYAFNFSFCIHIRPYELLLWLTSESRVFYNHNWELLLSPLSLCGVSE